MVAKHAKRFLLVLGLVLLLPGMVGAAGLKSEPAQHSFWEDSAAVLGRLWDGLTDALMSGASIDPNGKDPGPNGALCPDCGASIDPNG
jgi:hypothetical protein